MPKDGLNRLLREMQESGQTDSTGAFTISDTKAKEKLAQYQLSEPRFYVLNLLASAVAGEASFFRADFSTSEFVYEYDGSSYAQESLRDLFQQIIRPTDVFSQELAVAFNAMRSVSPKELCLETWDGQCGFAMTVEGERFSLNPLSEAPWRQSEIRNRVTIRESFQLNRVFQRWWGTLLEKGALAHIACWAPLNLSVNDRSLNQEIRVGLDSQTCFSWVRVGPEMSKLCIKEPDPDLQPNCIVATRSGCDLPIEGVICLDLPEAAEREGLKVLSNGVTFHRPSSDLNVPFAYGLLSGSFAKNLSHTDLSNDAYLREATAKMGQVAEVLMLRCMQNGVSIPLECQHQLIEWAPYLAQRFRERNWISQAQSVQLWIAETRFLLDIQNEDKWQDLLHTLEFLDSVRARDALKARLELSLEKVAQQEFEAGHYHQSQLLVGRLLTLEQLLEGTSQTLVAQNTQLVRALAGQEFRMDLLIDPGVRASVWRFLGLRNEAIDEACSDLNRGEAALGNGDFRRAEQCLRKAALIDRSPRVLQSLSDCLAFSDTATKQSQLEALRLLEESLGLLGDHLSTWTEVFSADIANLSRGIVPMSGWLSFHTRSVFSKSPGDELVSYLFKEFSFARQQRVNTLANLIRLQAALLKFEKLSPVRHPYQSIVRGRGAHLMRRAGYWKEADILLARGDLLETVDFGPRNRDPEPKELQ